MSELSKSVTGHLEAAVQEWADDNLEGKPAILANAMYFQLVKTMGDQAERIEKTFTPPVEASS